MRIVELHLHCNNEVVYINADQITHFGRDEDGISYVHFTKLYLDVIETPAQIAERLRGLP